jgi:lipoprotein-anchoring transpeptidase ErfK/SrfK
MLNKRFSRRDFLKFSAAGAFGLYVRPSFRAATDLESEHLLRVGIESVSVYAEPNDESRIIMQRYRDELVNYYYEVVSEFGPGYNPRWYRVWGGYIHSAHVVKVQNLINPILTEVPETGILGQVTVPYTQTIWDRDIYGLQPLYRLYYDSNHWIVGVREGPDGQPWYELRDELNELVYMTPAKNLRVVPPELLVPISPDVPAHLKRIEVSVPNQNLKAYEHDTLVFETNISSGRPDYNPDSVISTNTPVGTFNVYSKMPSKHMGDGNLTDDINAYELPGVPWTTFFAPHGVAFHGTYWHDNFGVPMSHGCINMRVDEANWIFRWTTPVNLGDRVEQVGSGTRVIVS